MYLFSLIHILDCRNPNLQTETCNRDNLQQATPFQKITIKSSCGFLSFQFKPAVSKSLPEAGFCWCSDACLREYSLQAFVFIEFARLHLTEGYKTPKSIEYPTLALLFSIPALKQHLQTFDSHSCSANACHVCMCISNTEPAHTQRCAANFCI